MNDEILGVARLQAALNVTSMMLECGYVLAASDPEFIHWLYVHANLPDLERQWTYHLNTYHAEA